MLINVAGLDDEVDAHNLSLSLETDRAETG